ncbi:MAG: cellulase family glycosylhydrolase [Lachnospiraceae bacterium]|nr:cellulase family glycosylhydrolase [Lachnospiraceae bacterium]
MRRLEGYSHGVNLGGWLSQCDHTRERYDNFIKEEDIETIRKWGLDHVRVPVDYNLFEDEQGNYKEEGFAYIQKAVDWCGKYGLNMVLDIHKTCGFSFDKGEAEIGFFDSRDYQERFYRMWTELAKRFGKYSDRVAFELLNEVTAKEYSDSWNAISTECIKRIRNITKDTKILLGGYWNNGIDALPDLPAPLDENVVYNFHCYEPLIFTHQGAGWIDSMDLKFRMPFQSTYGDYDRFSKEQLGNGFPPAQYEDKNRVLGIEYFENLVNRAVRIAEERNVQLYCGEFGVIENATCEDALKWISTICKCFDKFGIGRALWSYRSMNFGISDARMDPVRDEILKVL